MGVSGPRVCHNNCESNVKIICNKCENMWMALLLEIWRKQFENYLTNVCQHCDNKVKMIESCTPRVELCPRLHIRPASIVNL